MAELIGIEGILAKQPDRLPPRSNAAVNDAPQRLR